MKRILIVEDEHKLNDLVRDYLSSLGYDVIQAFDGNLALELVGSTVLDLIVLDVMLPGLDGIEVARRVRLNNTVPLLMLTARETEADKLLGLEVGADDYMTKPFSIRELGARIRAILRRTSVSATIAGPKRTLVCDGIELDPVRRVVSRQGEPVALTSAQFDLLRVLMSEPGRAFSRKELIESISGYQYEGYERTMDVHVKNLRKVIEDDPAQPSRLQTVWGVGYKFRETP